MIDSEPLIGRVFSRYVEIHVWPLTNQYMYATSGGTLCYESSCISIRLPPGKQCQVNVVHCHPAGTSCQSTTSFYGKFAMQKKHSCNLNLLWFCFKCQNCCIIKQQCSQNSLGWWEQQYRKWWILNRLFKSTAWLSWSWSSTAMSWKPQPPDPELRRGLCLVLLLIRGSRSPTVSRFPVEPTRLWTMRISNWRWWGGFVKSMLTTSMLDGTRALSLATSSPLRWLFFIHAINTIDILFQLLESQFSYQTSIDESVCLVFDTAKTSQGFLSVKAYR